MKPKQLKMRRIKRVVITTLSKQYPGIEFWGCSWSPELHLIVSWLFGPSQNAVLETVRPIIDDVQLTLRRGVACDICDGGLTLCSRCCPIAFGHAKPAFEAQIIPFRRPRAKNDHSHSGEAGS